MVNRIKLKPQSMRFIVFIYIIVPVVLACNLKNSDDQGGSDLDRICLNYTFKNEFPRSFKVIGDFIYVGIEGAIIKFDKAGNYVSISRLPDAITEVGPFWDFLPVNGGRSFYVTVYGQLYQFDEKSHELVVPKFGEVVRGAGTKYLVTFFQEYDSIRVKVINALRVYDTKADSVFTYPFAGDLGTYNLEVWDSNIGMVGGDKAFYVFPLEISKDSKIRTFSDDWDIAVFLGLEGNYNVFLVHDYDQRRDHLFFYDTDFKFVAEGIVDLPFEDQLKSVREDTDFRMDHPSGNLYAFDPDSKNIFFLRNYNHAVCVSSILEDLKVVRGNLNVK